MILGIDTSGDDTCAALVERDGRVLASVVSSRGLADPWGDPVHGVAPRRHLELVDLAVEDALARAGASLRDVRVVAVGLGPGARGGLRAGRSAARAIAATRGLPLAEVPEPAALAAAHELGPAPLAPPFACLVAEGARTLLLGVPDRERAGVLASAADDAAEELLAKAARLLGAGDGPEALAQLARAGDPAARPLPAVVAVGPSVALAALKTGLARAVRAAGGADGLGDGDRADLAAACLAALADGLAAWARRAAAAAGGIPLALCAGPSLAAPLAARLPEARALAPGRSADRGAMVAAGARRATPMLPGAYLGAAP
ncbi:MAG TPA: tRNA (adenosine(37)-N6)-threonylcarbamoyltransferase complex dimerization subunit type 1 TsaB [Capillimicrobium sp.]